MKLRGHDPDCDCVYCWRAFSRQVSAAYRRIEDPPAPAERRSARPIAHRTAFRFGRGLLFPWPPPRETPHSPGPRRSRRAE